MKKLFAFSMLIALALFSSCQKQTSSTEQDLAQRKVELDAREKALDAREKALDARDNMLAAARPRFSPNNTNTTNTTRTVSPEAQAQLRSLIADPNRIRAERQRRLQDRIAQRQQKLEELQKARVPDTAPATSPTSGSTTEATSPSPSPTPE